MRKVPEVFEDQGAARAKGTAITLMVSSTIIFHPQTSVGRPFRGFSFVAEYQLSRAPENDASYRVNFHLENLPCLSCRGQGFCPSSHNKKSVRSAVIYMTAFSLPSRIPQYVFSIPKIIRRYFLYGRKLLGKLSKCLTSYPPFSAKSSLLLSPLFC